MRKLLFIIIVSIIGCIKEDKPIKKEVSSIELRYHYTRWRDTNGNILSDWEKKPITRLVFKDRGHWDIDGDEMDWWKVNDKVLLHRSYVELIK